MSRTQLAFGCVVILLSSVAAFAAAPLMVNQLHRSFSVRELHINRGDVVRFNNVDEFLHQIYIDSPTFKFSSSEQSPGQIVEVAFPVRGTFDVRCQIHPKMSMSVVVE